MINKVYEKSLELKSKKKIMISIVLMLMVMVFNITFSNIASASLVGITDLQDTGVDLSGIGDIETDLTGGFAEAEAISVRVSHESGSKVTRIEEIDISIVAPLGINQAAAILYNKEDLSVVYKNIYTRESNFIYELDLSVYTPHIPIDDLYLYVLVQDTKKTVSRDFSYRMSAASLSSNLTDGTTYQRPYNADMDIRVYGSTSRVPIINMKISIVDKATGSVVDDMYYKVDDPSYKISESGELVMSKEFSAKGTYTRANTTCSDITFKYRLPSEDCEYELQLTATNLAGLILTRNVNISVKNFIVNMESSLDKYKNLETSDSVTFTVESVDSKGNSLDYGLRSFSAILYDSKGNAIASCDYSASTSSYPYGKSSMSDSFDIPYYEGSGKVIFQAYDIYGKLYEKTYKLTISLADEEDLIPSFVVETSAEYNNAKSSVYVESEVGFKFVEFKITCVDANGNVLKLLNGDDAVTLEYSSGRTKLYANPEVPVGKRSDLYYIMEATTSEGRVFKPAEGLATKDSTYRKGPYSVEENSIVVKSTPSYGSTLDYGDTITYSLTSSNKERNIQNVDYKVLVSKRYGNKSAKSGDYPLTILYSTKTDSNGETTSSTNTEQIGKGTVHVEVGDDGFVTVTITSLPELKYGEDNVELCIYRLYYSSAQWMAHALPATEGRGYKDVTLVYQKSTGYPLVDSGHFEPKQNTTSFSITAPLPFTGKFSVLITADDGMGYTYDGTLSYKVRKPTGSISVTPSVVSRAVGELIYVKVAGTKLPMGRCFYMVVKGSATYPTGENIITYGEYIVNSGSLSAEFNIPVTQEMLGNITVLAAGVDMGGFVFPTTKSYVIEKAVVIENPDDPRYIFQSATFASGTNEYVIEYTNFDGELKTVTLKEETVSGSEYFKTNVKDMQMRYSQINARLIELGEEPIPDITNIRTIYIRETLNYVNTCKIEGTETIVDIPRQVIIYKKVNENGDEVISAGYKGIANEISSIGNGGLVRDLFTPSQVQEILSKAQYQTLQELDLDNLDPNTSVNRYYVPENLSIGDLPRIIGNGTIAFNTTYINNTWLSKDDLSSGELVVVNPDPLENNIHVKTLQYYLEDYTVTSEDKSIHVNHGNFFDEVTGETYETCSDECEINISNVWSLYYAAIQYDKILTQYADPVLSYQYKTSDGVEVNLGQGDLIDSDLTGRVNLKVTATWDPKAIGEIVDELSNSAEDGKFGLIFNEDYRGREGYMEPFSASTEWKEVTVDLTPPNVYLSTQADLNNFYYNEKSGYYERSSDRGSKVQFRIAESLTADQLVSGIKDVKLQIKAAEMTDFVTIDSRVITQPERRTLDYTVDLLTLALAYDRANGTNISGLIGGGSFEIRILTTDFAGNESEGEIRVRRTDSQVSTYTSVNPLKVFINSSVNTNPLPAGSNSLINTDGTINLEVANSVGDGKGEADEKSALKLVQVMDTKWDSTNTNMAEGLDVDQFAVYSNSINDTIGLGYMTTFTLDTIGYGVDTGDRAIVNLKYYIKDGQTTVKELIPYISDTAGTYQMATDESRYRKLYLLESSTVNQNAAGLTGFSKNETAKTAKWRFSLFLPASTKFKLAEKNSESDAFVEPQEILVGLDIELYKYYSYNSGYDQTGKYTDSRHLYSLRDDKWAPLTSSDLKNKDGFAYKNYYINLRGTSSNVKGSVIWMDYERNATFDITGHRTQ